MESYLKGLIENLTREYTVKKHRFNNLKDDVIQLQYTVEKMCGTQRQNKENVATVTTSCLWQRIEDVKQRLCLMMREIGSLQTEDSEEHRFLRAVVSRSEHCLRQGPVGAEHQVLVTSIQALRELHEYNCHAKEGLENIVNRAHHQLNKLEKKLTQQYTKKSPGKKTRTCQNDQMKPTKEDSQLGKGDNLSRMAPLQMCTHRGLAVRDTNVPDRGRFQ